MAKFCTHTRADRRTCAGLYVYRGRRYENNDICVHVGLHQPAGWLVATAAQGLCITINSTGLAAAWAATVTSQACRYQSSCSGPTGRNSLYNYKIFLIEFIPDYGKKKKIVTSCS